MTKKGKSNLVDVAVDQPTKTNEKTKNLKISKNSTAIKKKKKSKSIPADVAADYLLNGSENIIKSSTVTNLNIKKKRVKKPYIYLDTEPDGDHTDKKAKRKRQFLSYNKLENSALYDLDQREKNLKNSLLAECQFDDESEIILDDSQQSDGSENMHHVADGCQSDIDKEESSDDDNQVDRVEAKPKRRSVWADEDENIRVCDVITTSKKGKKEKSNNSVFENLEYKSALKDKFADVVGGIPEWADLDREVESEEDDMTKTTGTYLKSKYTQKTLPKTTLEYKPLPHFNGKSLSEGMLIKSIEFSAKLGIALVAGCTQALGAVTLFQNDGKQNLKIHSIKFPKFPIKCAKFLDGGKKFVVGTDVYGFFFIYDIEAGKRTEIPWNKSDDRNSMKNFEVSPDGKLLVFAGNGGEIYIFETSTMSQIEMLRVPCEVRAIDFDKDSKKLFTYGDNGNVYIFDLRSMKCIHSFYDEGCIKGTSIAVSPNGHLLACGSSSGIVNVYNISSVTSSMNPKPLKSFDNLVTPVTSLKFNPSSEILAMASSYKDNAIKLVHTNSLAVFPNFPTAQSKLKRIQMVNFSPDSKYLVAGSNVKAAYHFRLFHY